MVAHRIRCPECGAGLKSASGFTPGKTVLCPRCGTYFVVPERNGDAGVAQAAGPSAAAGPTRKTVRAAVVAEDDDDRPKKKKKKPADDDEEWSYANSPLRYVVLGVLVTIMCVLGFLLYRKHARESSEEVAQNTSSASLTPPPAPPSPLPGGGGFVPPPGGVTPKGTPGGPGGGPPIRPTPVPKGPTLPKGPVPKQPLPGGGVPGRPPTPGPAISPLDALLGPSTFQLSPAEAEKLTHKLREQLLGTWKADLGNGRTAEVTYLADGHFTDTLISGGQPRTVSGTWTITGLTAGYRGLTLGRTVQGVTSTVTAIFEDDELIHDTLEKGLAGVFRRK